MKRIAAAIAVLLVANVGWFTWRWFSRQPDELPAEWSFDDPALVGRAVREWATRPCVVDTFGAPVVFEPVTVGFKASSVTAEARAIGSKAKGRVLFDGERGPKLIGFAPPSGWTPLTVTLELADGSSQRCPVR